MAKARPPIEVLVLGSHPCCYFATALLKSEGAAVAQCSIPGELPHDRLVQVNPKLLELHKLLGALKKDVELTPIHGLRFLADDPATRAEHVAKSPMAFVASLKEIRAAMHDLAKKKKAELLDPKRLEILGVDESGVDLMLNGSRIKPRMLLVGGRLSPQQSKVLGIFNPPDAEAPRRYTYLRIKGGGKLIDKSARAVMPMSLDLRGKLRWGWLLFTSKDCQVAIENPASDGDVGASRELLGHWISVLAKHNVLLVDPNSIETVAAESIELPLAGALSQESVANRALLIGPAGGFYTACAEDVYPACWSALFAAEVAHKALREKHLQDAIQPYRQRWGTTLGDYLRGPQQNLRFLLPLVYRNPVMTARMSEAILSGSSVVR